MTAAISQLHLFEQNHWEGHVQKPVWRHRIAQQLITKGSVLDVGGGDGLLLSCLGSNPKITRSVLLDVSPEAIRKAKEKGLEAQEFDLAKPLPFPDRSFDVACALDTLEHLYQPVHTLREMGRVAKSVVITVPNFHYWKGRLHMLIGRVPFQSKPQRGHVHWFNYPILCRVVAQAGLKIDELHCEGFVRLGPIGRTLARWFPNMFAISFAVKLSPAPGTSHRESDGVPASHS